MLKVTQPARMMNSMGTQTVPALDFEEGANWDVIEGSLIVYDAHDQSIAQFAPGHWSHIVLVD